MIPIHSNSSCSAMGASLVGLRPGTWGIGIMSPYYPKSEEPGAPSSWFEKITGTGATPLGRGFLRRAIEAVVTVRRGPAPPTPGLRSETWGNHYC
jgi:hypothetical protein